MSRGAGRRREGSAGAWGVGSSEGAGSSWPVRSWNPSADVPEPFQLCLSRLQVTDEPQDRSQDNHLHLPQGAGGQLSRTVPILGSPRWSPRPRSASGGPVTHLSGDEMACAC